MNRYVCIHSHFYQPPRENPWLEEVELQDSAYPYHDWNERITTECYAPNTASRILDEKNRIIDIVNNYRKISFNFGPTILSWLEKHSPNVYKSILEADQLSCDDFSGHGTALAQPYNHIIMPLATLKDKHTQIIWGINDFVHRFKRKPEGMWLPETAVDIETLTILSEQDIKFTILSPYQAHRIRKIGEPKWIDANGGKINPKIPYICNLPHGKNIAIFFYDGHISRDVAFGGLLNNGENFAKRMLSVFSGDDNEPQLVNVATDGETYGHHHRHGDMALAYCLYHIESKNLAKITIYGEYLEKHKAKWEVEIIENSSWSCSHGVERWRDNCGCNLGGSFNQEWRKYLRESMDWLRDKLYPIYDKKISVFVKNPWEARDEYIKVILNRSKENVEHFFLKQAAKKLTNEEKITTLKLLEMQRYAMLMYTSCGWFFDEISGIEAAQVMQYACRTIQLAQQMNNDLLLEEEFVKILGEAKSNISELGTGKDVWEKFVKPKKLNLLKVGAHYVVSSLFQKHSKNTPIYCYRTTTDEFNSHEIGIQKMTIGRVKFHSTITWEESALSFSALYLGAHNLNGGVIENMDNTTFISMSDEIKNAFLKSDIPEVIRIMHNYFGLFNFSLLDLFKDEQRKVLDKILESPLREIEDSFRHIYEHYYPLINVMLDMNIPLPKPLAGAVEFIFNHDFCNVLKNNNIEINSLQKIVKELQRWGFERERDKLSFVASENINVLMDKLFQSPQDLTLIETIKNILSILNPLSLKLEIWKAQNIYFLVGKDMYQEMRKKIRNGESEARQWLRSFNRIGHFLKVKCK